MSVLIYTLLTLHSANDSAKQDDRRTIAASDVLEALELTGFHDIEQTISKQLESVCQIDVSLASCSILIYYLAWTALGTDAVASGEGATNHEEEDTSATASAHKVDLFKDSPNISMGHVKRIVQADKVNALIYLYWI